MKTIRDTAPILTLCLGCAIGGFFGGPTGAIVGSIVAGSLYMTAQALGFYDDKGDDDERMD